MSSKLEFLWRFDRMGIVVTKNAFAIGLMQCQRVTNSMRNIRRYTNPPCLNLDPIASALINNLIVQIDEGRDSVVFAHGEVYHPLIKFSTPSFFFSSFLRCCSIC